MTLLSAPAGRCTELMHSMLAPPPSTIGVCNSTCQPPNNNALYYIWRLYPSHCVTPTISTADLTVLAACNVLRTLRNTIPTSASRAATRSTAIRDLCTIINLTLPPSAIVPRVGAALEPRVPPSTITRLPGIRVLHSTISNSLTPASLYPQNATFTINATSWAHVHATRFVYQQVTCNNNPFAPLADKEPKNPTNHAPTDCYSNNVTRTTSNQAPACTQLHPEPTTHLIVLALQIAPMRPSHPTVTPRVLCSGRVIPVSPLIAPTQQYIQQTCNKSQHAPTLSVPTPIPTAMPTRATHHNPITPPTIYPPTKPITPFNTHPSPAYIEPNDDDRDNTPAQSNRLAIQINSPCGLANISRQALYHVINLAFNSPPKYIIPQALVGLPDCILHSINVKEVCNGFFTP
jgi:hypothetical protein